MIAIAVPFTDKRQHTPPLYFTQAKYIATKCLRIFFECAMLRSVDSDNNQTEETNMSIEQTLQNIADALLKVAEANASYRASIGAYAAAKAAQQKAVDKVSTGEAEIAAALAKARAEKAKPAAEGDPLDAAPLDWDKDVRPALLAVGKDRDALVKLMAKYEVPKGGKAPAEKWADLLAEANAIVAARG